MSDVSQEHILRELRLLREGQEKVLERLEQIGVAVSGHADRHFDSEVRITELERHASNGSASGE